ncbi:MAG: nitroreductase family deazaflavin-dependent oxidoreductase [Cellulomonas sp.]|nr:nitroreductase family deazaflavin-dependent oxidoreductase [Cellulomonas sp.]
MYADGRPNRLARWLNALSEWQYRHGILTLGGRGVTLETRGRGSGKQIRLPLVLVRQGGHRYVVSMLGTSAQWLRNVQADDGRAVLHSPRPEHVRLVEVPVAQRAPILKRYLELAPGARPHIPVDRHEPVERFEQVAADYPVLRVQTD